jgi:serine/threonine protein kinase/TPR repeat protein
METSNYQIGSQIGKGGMAVVYEAIHKSLGHNVAIKVLNPEFRIQENIRKRFLEEARRLARMNHANLVKVIDSIEEGDMVAFVMEYIDGKNLREYLHAKGRLGNVEIESFLGQMIEALVFVHRNGLIHRDIKPSNFMVSDAGQIKLLDFGIAKNINQSPAEYTQTGTGVQMGTPIYMSPEQVHGAKNLNEKSDQYSLGVVLWEMVSGRKPYDADTLSGFQIQSKIVNESLPLTGTHWDDVIQKATSKDPEMRYGSLSEMLPNRSILNSPVSKDSESTVIGIATKQEEKTQLNASPEIPELRDNSGRSAQLQSVFWALFCLTIVALVSDWFEYNLLKELLTGNSDSAHLAETSDLRQGIMGIMQVGLNVVCIVYFLRWFRRSYENAHKVVGSNHMKFRESEALWAWFIPFVNLYRPYHIAKETWNSMKSSLGIGRNDENTGIILLWWWGYVISSIVDRAILRRSLGREESQDLLLDSGLNFLSDGLTLVSIIFTIMMVKTMSEMEHQVFRKFSGSKEAEPVKNNGVWFILGSFLAVGLMSFLYLNSSAEIAEEVKRGTKAYDSSDFTTAYSIFSKDDLSSDKVAQYHLGLMHLYGQGVSEDNELAKKWLEKSAEQDDADAQTMLGYMYENGLTNSANPAVEAFNWYKKSAEQGNSVGQNNLGMCYMQGTGTEIDTIEAFRYVKLSADQNCTQAFNNLAWMYENGRCVEKNLTETYNYYLKSAQLGDAEGERNLALCYWNGTGVAKSFPEADSWLRKAVAQNDPYSHWYLGILLENGIAALSSMDAAVEEYKKAADLGVQEAKDRLRELGYQYTEPSASAH